MIEHYVIAASTYARDVDNLIYLIGVPKGRWPARRSITT